MGGIFRGRSGGVRPPGFQLDALRELTNVATGLFRGGGPQPFTGERVAGFTPDQEQAFDLLRSFALGGSGEQFAQAALQANQFLLNPESFLNPETLPGLAGLNENIVNTLNRNLQETQLPAIRDQFIGTGAFGGSRQAIAEGQAVGRTNEAIAGQISQNNFRAFQEGLQAFQRAIGLAPQTFELGTGPGQLLRSIGLDQQTLNQLQLDAARSQFEEEQFQPFLNAQLFRDLVSGNAGQTTQAAQPSLAGQLLGLGLGGFGLFRGK